MKINFVKGIFRGRKLPQHFLFPNPMLTDFCKYILNQPEHRKKETFADEYEKFIKFYQQRLKPFSRE
jgi:hypothetical protein